MADYLENTLCRPRQLKIFIASLASTVVDVADYLNIRKKPPLFEEVFFMRAQPQYLKNLSNSIDDPVRLIQNGGVFMAYKPISMLAICSILFLAGVLPLASLAETGPSPVPSNPNATPEVKAVLRYLADLPNRTENRVLSGQNCGHGDELADPNGYNAYEHYIEGLYQKTGKYVAILSIDYEYMAIYTSEQLRTANGFLIDYWKNGGLAAVNYTPRNPFVDDGSGEPQQSDKSRVDLAELLDPKSAKTWRKRLDTIADGLKELDDAGVVVLWRPMQEMNGWWFWYGRQSLYKELWIDMYNYFTYEKKLNNLLWVYDSAEAVSLYPESYPGDAYVDIVGNNPYNDDFYMGNNYGELLEYKKVYACPETGFDLNRTEEPKDLMDLINSIRNDYPMTTYFVQWHNCGPDAMIALVENINADRLLNDPWVITRDEVNWRAYMEM